MVKTKGLVKLVKSLAPNLWNYEFCRSLIHNAVRVRTHKTAGAVCSGNNSLPCESIVKSGREEVISNFEVTSRDRQQGKMSYQQGLLSVLITPIFFVLGG